MTPPPNTYYEMLDERLPNHGEPADQLQKRGILLDGNTKDGNKRLFESIERDQIKRGVLDVSKA